MGNKATTEEQTVNVPVTTLVGYNVDYLPYYGTILPVKRPVASVVNVPVNVKVTDDKSSKTSYKPPAGKLKYSDNNVEMKAKWSGSQLSISKKCK